MKITFRGIWAVLKNSFSGFSNDRILSLSAALAYYTVFSLGPLLIVLIFICGFFFGNQAIEGTIYGQIQGFVGHDAALQLQDIIKSAAIGGKGKIAAVIGIAALLIGATSMFAEMQDSINLIWELKPKPKSAIWLFIKNRLLSFGVIGSLGFLLLVTLAVSGLIEALSHRLQSHFHAVTVTLFYIVDLILNFGIITILFGVIFKVLPDAKIKWKDVRAGSLATAILFMAGKFAISWYITKTNVGSTYGTAGSLVVLLVWVYYSSVILYFGAEFTKAFAMKYGGNIMPSDYAVISKTIEVEHENIGFQQIERQEKEKK